MRRARFQKLGLLAIAPKSWGLAFDTPEPTAIQAAKTGDVAIVEIRGPLTHHSEWWWDSYDAILDRFDVACGTSAKTIILKIDSPGGDCAGSFEAARTMRARAAAAGKTVIAFADGMAASAGYSLACAADRIVVSTTSCIGSIGVIAMLVDETRWDEQMGLRVAVVASGARKTDNHPHVAISEAAVGEAQRQVDQLAAMFFDLVSEARGLAPQDVAGLEAGVFFGAAGVAAGLADEVVTSFSDLLAAVASGSINTNAPPGAAEAAVDYDEMVAALKKCAEGDDESAEKARKALAAMGEGDDKDAKAEGDDDGDKKDDDKKDAKAKGAASNVRDISTRVAALETRAIVDERRSLIASRPDLAADKALQKWLAAATTPIETVRHAIASYPRPKLPPKAADVVAPAATRGGPSPSAATRHSAHADQLDEEMGLKRAAPPVTHARNQTSIRSMTRAEAIEFRKSLKGGG